MKGDIFNPCTNCPHKQYDNSPQRKKVLLKDYDGDEYHLALTDDQIALIDYLKAHIITDDLSYTIYDNTIDWKEI